MIYCQQSDLQHYGTQILGRNVLSRSKQLLYPVIFHFHGPNIEKLKHILVESDKRISITAPLAAVVRTPNQKLRKLHYTYRQQEGIDVIYRYHLRPEENSCSLKLTYVLYEGIFLFHLSSHEIKKNNQRGPIQEHWQFIKF